MNFLPITVVEKYGFKKSINVSSFKKSQSIFKLALLQLCMFNRKKCFYPEQT